VSVPDFTPLVVPPADHPGAHRYVHVVGAAVWIDERPPAGEWATHFIGLVDGEAWWGVDVPVTVDAEGGYGMEPAELVAALRDVGAAGCNLEDTDHAAGRLRDPAEHAEWLAAVLRAASDDGYPLVVNARVDVFLAPFFAGADIATQKDLVPDALRRATAYVEAGVDCVYPIALCELEALQRFMSEVGGAVNVIRLPQTPSLPELAELGVARVSWATLLYREAMARFEAQLASLQ